MKKIFYTLILALAATTASAQGIKIIKTDGTTIDIPAAELSRIEAYDAPAEAPFYEGQWQMHEFVTTAEEVNETMWGGMLTQGEAYPEFNAADKLTFANGKLTPELKSRLKNFFIGEAEYEEAGTLTLHIDFLTTAELTLLKVKGVNRNFDAATVSEDKEAYIGVRLLEDEDADEAGVYLLDVYLIDFQSTSFFPEFNDYNIYDTEKPVATSSGTFINFTMKKAE